jgi:hypothetical protein
LDANSVFLDEYQLNISESGANIVGE